MIEDMEIEARGTLCELYIMKTREVVNSIRPVNEAAVSQKATLDHVNSLKGAIFEHGKSRRFDSDVSSQP